MDLYGKTVLVTGAAQRIGREVAFALAQAGSRLVIHYRQSQKEAQSLKNEIEIRGGEAVLLRADFSARSQTVEKTIRRMVKDVYRQVKRVDVLINNASVFYPTRFGKISEKQWNDILTVNLKYPFFLAQEFGGKMRRQKSGKIINLVDWTGFRPAIDYLPYCISKAGLIAATAGLAKALAPHVQVNSIAPGPILPPPGMSHKRQSAVAKKTLLKRFGHPRDIASAVRFLLEGSDFITGAMIPVDGGSLLA